MAVARLAKYVWIIYRDEAARLRRELTAKEQQRQRDGAAVAVPSWHPAWVPPYTGI